MSKRFWIIQKTVDESVNLGIVKSARSPNATLASEALGWGALPGDIVSVIACDKVPDIDRYLRRKIDIHDRNRIPMNRSELQVLGHILMDYEERLEQDDTISEARTDMFDYDDQYIDLNIEEDFIGHDTEVRQAKLPRRCLASEGLTNMKKLLDAIEDK